MSHLTKIVLLLLLISLTACAAAPKQNLALERLRNSLEQLKSNQQLRGYAPLALGDAERALREAAQPGQGKTRHDHLLYMADRRIRIARALAEREQLRNELESLEEQENQLLLKAQAAEAKRARHEAERVRMLNAALAEEAERERLSAQEAEASRLESDKSAKDAREEAAAARSLAEAQAVQAELARQEAKLASQQNQTLKRQLDNMQLRQTESGVVVTLGDVLFESGQASLKSSAAGNLEEVITLLQSDQSKKIRIEGHTDSVGSAAANLRLSEQRAIAVKEALQSRGVDAARLSTLGLGEDFPIDTNDTEEGRSNNRRVDVILLDK